MQLLFNTCLETVCCKLEAPTSSVDFCLVCQFVVSSVSLLRQETLLSLSSLSSLMLKDFESTRDDVGNQPETLIDPSTTRSDTLNWITALKRRRHKFSIAHLVS